MIGWEDLVAEATAKPPPGWATSEEIAKKCGLSRCHVSHMLSAASKAGRIRRIKCRGFYYYPPTGTPK